MKPVIVAADDFFKNPDTVRAAILTGTFEDFASPWDGVTYPGINKAIPDFVRGFFKFRLQMIMGHDIEIQALFARVTSEKTGAAPHQIHSDKIMGEYSAHVYLSTTWPDDAGTGFWTHRTEGPMHTDDTKLDAIEDYMNDPVAWSRSMIVQGKFNRLLIHDARAWHSAEPVGGWGDSPENGRVVLTCFFNAVVP